MDHALERLLVRHTLRLPVPAGPAGDGSAAALRFDAALRTAGFALSPSLLRELSGRPGETVVELARRALEAVRERVGDHVRHNAYFIDFPRNVPDTQEFWLSCVLKALDDPEAREAVEAQPSAGVLNLLTLPAYGRYPHTYEELLAAHAELTPSGGDRLTVLHLGGPTGEELGALYLSLAGSVTPLGEEHLADLAVLAAHCADGPQPAEIPVRENRAVVNAARLRAGAAPLLDTVTDVLRLACALSDGDVTLRERTRFRSLSRPLRRILLAALDGVVAAAPEKLADVAPYREAWKRLGERLHPHAYPAWPHAAEVFAVARGESRAPSLDSRVEALLARDDVPGAADLLASAAPGRLFRALDRLLRTAADEAGREAVLAAVERSGSRVAGRVVLSVREHVQNRGAGRGAGRRVFVNRAGGAWVAPDTRPALPAGVRERLVALLDAETRRRLPVPERILVAPEALDVALPLSGRASSGGFGVLPRGSVSPVDGELLRFFMYWKQTRLTTDLDLSALVLDERYRPVTWLSYTALADVEGVHSGDVVAAPDGASEFIDLRLDAVRGTYIVPQVHVFEGEGFEATEESFFGFMLRDREQRGRPFEPRTVRMKSDLRGPGRVALPLAFRRDDEGRWHAHWLHLCLRGAPAANRVEDHRVSVTVLLRGLMGRRPLTVGHLVRLMEESGSAVTLWEGGEVPEEPVTYLGLERPDGLAEGSVVVTPENLRDLIPA
ncbi:TerD family protein [Streptomyces roseolus]|uniref:TerD family protein n=1 Tax=Streptomyces roseolus TaxID=67358 RepID=UPI001679B55C|nr:TerD family protein [Streptomyces roseolus]